MADKRVIPIHQGSLGRGAARDGAHRLTQLPPLSLYIHFPWCVRKCPYCDFNSHEWRGDIPQADYVAALVADLEQALPFIWGRRVVSIFIGGGTPSLLEPALLDNLLAAIRSRLTLIPGAEVTLEANPGTVDSARFRAFRDAGVNRLSIGIQSFNDTHLKALGRIHDAADAHRAVEAGLASFDNVNLDLMYALPGQTLAQAEADVRTAAAYGVPHLSAYHLTLEPNTAFHANPPQVPDADDSADMQDMVEATLAAAGYGHYETSAFAQSGRECHHNLNYWQFGDYLGIGAGAHGKISFHDRIIRQARQRHPQAYMDGARDGRLLQNERAVAADELPFEFMMNALRLLEGVPTPLFEHHTGVPLAAIAPQLAAAADKGLLSRDPTRLAPTELGRRFLNDLLELFLRDGE